MKHISIKLVESLGSKRRVLKLDKAHGTVLLGTETKSLVPALFRKDSLEFVFGRVHGEITHVESVAWGVLISRIHWRVCWPRKVLRVLLVASVGTTAQGGWNAVW